MTIASVTVESVPDDQIDYAPADQSNPPDPQVSSGENVATAPDQINNDAAPVGTQDPLSNDVAQLNADGSVNLSQFNKGPTDLPVSYTGEAVNLAAGTQTGSIGSNGGFFSGSAFQIDPQSISQGQVQVGARSKSVV